MKIKIKTVGGGKPRNLTRGKIYEAKSHPEIEGVYTILGDNGDNTYIRLSSCSHLNGGSWEVINE